MTILAKDFYGIERKVFVGKKTHGLERQSIYFFGLEGGTRVAEASLDVFKGDAGIVAKNLVGCPALGKEIDDELYGKTGAFDDGFADQDIGVKGNSGLPVHSVQLNG